MNRFLPITLSFLISLALLTGCGLPADRNDGSIPNTGQQPAQDYPAPSDAAATPEAPPPFDEDEAGEVDEGQTVSDTATVAPPMFQPPEQLPTETAIVEESPTPTATLTPFVTEPAQASPTASQMPTATETAALAPASPTPAASALPEMTPTVPGPSRDSLLGREQFFSELAASRVRNLTDGVIGAVNGIVFDSLSGAPLYAVVAPEWMLGISRGSVPVPWGALNLAGQGIYQPQAGILLLPVPSHVLSTAPTIDRRQWDEQSPPADWDTGVADYWENFVPIIPQAGSTNLVRGLPLLVDTGRTNNLSIDVTDSEGETLGRVKDLVVDADGNVRYALVHVDDFLGMGGRLAPVPWRRLVWSPGGWFILQGNPGALLAAPGYPNRGAFPAFNQPDWDREIRGYWAD